MINIPGTRQFVYSSNPTAAYIDRLMDGIIHQFKGWSIALGIYPWVEYILCETMKNPYSGIFSDRKPIHRYYATLSE